VPVDSRSAFWAGGPPEPWRGARRCKEMDRGAATLSRSSRDSDHAELAPARKVAEPACSHSASEAASGALLCSASLFRCC
jgi:hypothetical protein